MKLDLVLAYGEKVLDVVGLLRGRRAIEAQDYHEALTKRLQGALKERDELIKTHGTDGAIKPGDSGWSDFLEGWKDVGDTEIDLPVFTISDEDVEKLDLELAQIQILKVFGLRASAQE